MIEFAFIDVEVPGLNPELFVLWLSDTVVNENRICGDINLIFCSDEYLLNMNRTYLEHDFYTDIITFDYCDGGTVNGDLFISIDRIRDNAMSLSVSYEEELRRVCVHGVLHLCGYGDKTSSEEKVMREKENFYLDRYVSRGT